MLRLPGISLVKVFARHRRAKGVTFTHLPDFERSALRSVATASLRNPAALADRPELPVRAFAIPQHLVALQKTVSHPAMGASDRVKMPAGTKEAEAAGGCLIPRF